MKRLIYMTLAAAVCANAQAASPLREPEKAQLIQRIQGGDRAAMLEAGSTADTSFIPTLEKCVQGRIAEATNTLLRLQQVARDNPGFVPLTANQIGLLDNDARFDAAKEALAKLGVKQYLDEIISELTATNTSSGRVLSAGEKRRAQVSALKKLGYVGNPSTVKFIGPCLYDTADPYPQIPGARDKYGASPLASYAIEALRSMITNTPAAGDYAAWQRWWEQNKDKYP